MKVLNKPLILLTIATVFCATNSDAIAQMAESDKRNNPYSPSPAGKIIEKQLVSAPERNNSVEAVFIVTNPGMPTTEDRPLIAKQTVKITTNTESRTTSPSEIYKVGVGDVLFINLKNSPQGSSYCTVHPDGKIDFPLAGEDLIVAGQTVDAIEEIIDSGITLFSDPKIEVTVREYSSHKITVSGMVENPGDKSLHREAMPLFAIRSEVGVDQKATRALVKRAPLLKLESYDLHDATTDSVMIYPGNSIEFVSDPAASYYITGEVNSSGQRDLITGITLYQAVIASGAKGDPKKATIRRRNDDGLFANTAYDLRSIKKGITADPVLQPGDVIEVQK